MFEFNSEAYKSYEEYVKCDKGDNKYTGNFSIQN